MTALALLAATPSVHAQLYTGATNTGLWSSARWSSSTNPPFNSAWVNNSDAVFLSGNTYTFTGSGTTNIGNVTVQSNATVTFSAISGTLGTGGAVRTMNVESGSLLDFAANAISVAAGTGFIKTGGGVFATGGSTNTGGFTLNGGTMILRAVNSMGGGAANVLTLSNGVLAANATRSMDSTKYGGGILVRGDIQFGAFSNAYSNTSVQALVNDTAGLGFANNVDLGGTNRTFTLGSRGFMNFGGVISNGSLTFASVVGAQVTVSSAGAFQITNTANTFTGDININGPDVRIASDGSLGNAANNIIIDGGRLGMVTGTTAEIAATRDIFVGDAAGTSISAVGATGLLTYNGTIKDKVGETGSWIKQGAGTLVLGGASTYSGTTRIAQGILLLTNGNNRLPTGTVLSLGQAGSANLGTLDLNGNNQEVAGLSSTVGNNATTNNNTVTSASAATLTVNTAAGQSYTFGAGTAANSGLLAGSLALMKSGTGTQVLGGDNTYTGITTVSAGELRVNGNQSLATGNVTVAADATLSGSGTIGGATTINGRHNPGSSPGVQSFNSGLTYNAGAVVNWELTGNTATGRGTVFDGINLLGASNVNFAGATALNLVFNQASSVDWANSFWGENQSWLVYDLNGGVTQNFENLALNTQNWADSLDNEFNLVRAGASFSLSQTGEDIFLVYTVPEPSTWLLLAFGAGALTVRSLRRRWHAS